MNERKFNAEYALLFKELALLARPYGATRTRGVGKGAILIVVPCLIGEFVTAVPAIRDFILRHPGARVDLVVSSGQTGIARRIRGVGQVYGAASVYGREAGAEERPRGPYERIIFLRASADALALVRGVRAAAIETSFLTFASFGTHLFLSVVFRATPRQWRALNFKMLGGTPRAFSFDELFDFEKEDKDRIANLPELASEGALVLVHTGATWPMKHWNTANWIEALTRIHSTGDFRFVFIGHGAVDEADYAAIAPALGFPSASLIGKLSLEDTALLMTYADYFIGIDSGPSNLAYLTELPGVTVYGPSPHFYLPYSARNIALDKSRGRGLLQFFFAKKRNFISQITPEEVSTAFLRVVAEDRKV